MQDAEHENTCLSGTIVHGVGHRLVPTNTPDDETVIRSEIRVLRRHLDLGVERLRVLLGLNWAEKYDTVEEDVDQVPLGVARELNFRHEVDPFVGPPGAQPQGYPGMPDQRPRSLPRAQA